MDILLFDGRDEFRRVLSAYLQGSGHQVQAVAQVGPALALLDSHRPDAVMVERGVLLHQGEALLLAMTRHSSPPAVVFAPQASEESQLAQVTERTGRVERVRRHAEDAVTALPMQLQKCPKRCQGCAKGFVPIAMLL